MLAASGARGGDDRPRGGRRALARRRDRPRAGDRRAAERAAARDRGGDDALEHLESLLARMGAQSGLRHARKHLAAYADRGGRAEPAAARAGDDRRRRRGARLLARPSTRTICEGGRMNRRERPRQPSDARGRTRCGCSTPCRSRCSRSTRRGAILEVNTAAEHFFDMGRTWLLRSRLADLLPFGSPVFELVADAIATQSTVNGYKLDISTPRTGARPARRRFRRAAADERRRRDAAAAGTVNCRKNGQTTDPPQRRPLGDGARRHARA